MSTIVIVVTIAVLGPVFGLLYWVLDRRLAGLANEVGVLRHTVQVEGEHLRVAIVDGRHSSRAVFGQAPPGTLVGVGGLDIVSRDIELGPGEKRSLLVGPYRSNYFAAKAVSVHAFDASDASIEKRVAVVGMLRNRQPLFETDEQPDGIWHTPPGTAVGVKMPLFSQTNLIFPLEIELHNRNPVRIRVVGALYGRPSNVCPTDIGCFDDFEAWAERQERLEQLRRAAIESGLEAEGEEA